MNSIMEGLRKDPPEKLGLKVERIRDYSTGKILNVKDGSTGETGLPESNVLFYDLEGGCSLIIRPSGTEPKIKLYVMTRGQSEKEAQELYDLVKAAGMEKLGTGQK